jgi:hypothetical protein
MTFITEGNQLVWPPVQLRDGGSSSGSNDAADTAVVMLTHTDTPRLVRHFERLEREAGIPTFRARHLGHLDPGGGPASFELTNHDLARQLPTRYAEMLRLNRNFDSGYTDINVWGAVTHELVANFKFVWIVEGDVDFSGCWSDFFALYADNDADLLASRIRRRSENPDWTNWIDVKVPEGVEPYAAFLPACRLSRRFIEAYRRNISQGGWQGHHEAMEPTVAIAEGLKIENMEGTGEFAAREARVPLDPDTFDFRPTRSTSYFHEAPEKFLKANFLYHPVKPNEEGMRARRRAGPRNRSLMRRLSSSVRKAAKRLVGRSVR